MVEAAEEAVVVAAALEAEATGLVAASLVAAAMAAMAVMMMVEVRGEAQMALIRRVRRW